LDRDRFPVDPWAWHERIDPETGPDLVGATLFALANGRVGVRGDGPEGRGLGQGSFVNGFHETAWISHPEPAHGLAQVQQWTQGVPDLAQFVVRVGGRELTDDWAERESDRRSLDFRAGWGRRQTDWRLPEQGRVEVVQTRLVSFTRPDLAVFVCRVRPGDQAVELDLAGLWQENAVPPGDPVGDRAADPVDDPASDRAYDRTADLAIHRVDNRTSDPVDHRAGDLASDSGYDRTADPASHRADDRTVDSASDRAIGSANDQTVDPRRGQAAESGDLIRIEDQVRAGTELRAYRCRNSGLRLVVGRRLRVELTGPPGGPAPSAAQPSPDPDGAVGGLSGPWSVPAGGSLTAYLYVTYQTDHLAPLGVEAGSLRPAGQPDRGWDDLFDAGADCLERAEASGWAVLSREQADWLADFWERSDVSFEAGPDSDRWTQAVRWSLFQLAQASARAEGHGVGAKGLSGSGYCGHYFWDAEIYLVPFLTYTDPAQARALLEFRHAMLPAARRRARVMDQAGALFPWRTIDGEEASAYFPAGTAQYHIDADIAFAAAQYIAVSGDQAFQAGPGVDLLVETARMWASLGHWGDDGCFHIHQVTGPDEYSALVDDNFFTNTMAAFNLTEADRTLARLEAERPGDHAAAVARLALGPDEPAQWRRAGQAMALLWDAAHGVHPQDAAFLSRPPWPVERLGPPSQPLLLRHHPLVIYRYQVLKQADVVLALLLRSNQFSLSQKRADFDFYDRLTTGDSTLSAAVQAIVAAEVGHGRAALEHFRATLLTDLADLHGNTRDGVHIAAAAGVWAVLTQGFGGLRDSGQRPSLDPRLPDGWSRLGFRLRLAGQTVAVALTPGRLRLDLVEGAGLELEVAGRPVRVTPGAPVEIDLPPAPAP
jgi:alpha,alpha-trehalose phosphorylase